MGKEVWESAIISTDMPHHAVQSFTIFKMASRNGNSNVPRIDERYASFKLSIRRSGIHRHGLFAEEFIPRGRKVIEYTGERINRRETRRRSDEQASMIYLFTLDPYWTLDGSVGGSGAEYINHCCDPNIRTLVTKGHILYMAARDIRKGEELTVDYHFSKDVDKIPCKCGSPKCRGTINVQ